jgi:uncharacterized protein
MTTPPNRREILFLATGSLALGALACAAPHALKSKATTMDKHPNLKVIEEFFAAYAAHDIERIRKTLANDVVWRIPGHHPLAGEKRGAEEVVAFFDQLGKANFKAQPLVIVAQDDYVIDHHRGWSDVAGGLDITWCLVFKFEDGRIKDVTNFAGDQHKADLFFWSVYKLRPIPDRLADR